MKKNYVCLKCCRKAKDVTRTASRLSGVCDICNKVSCVAEVGEQKYQDIRSVNNASNRNKT